MFKVEIKSLGYREWSTTRWRFSRLGLGRKIVIAMVGGVGLALVRGMWNNFLIRAIVLCAACFLPAMSLGGFGRGNFWPKKKR